MERIYRVTVPGLLVTSDFTAARERLLAGFPRIHDVLATTAPATLLVLYSGLDDVEAWTDALLASVVPSSTGSPSGLLLRQGGRLGGGDSAA